MTASEISYLAGCRFILWTFEYMGEKVNKYGGERICANWGLAASPVQPSSPHFMPPTFISIPLSTFSPSFPCHSTYINVYLISECSSKGQSIEADRMQMTLNWPCRIQATPGEISASVWSEYVHVCESYGWLSICAIDLMIWKKNQADRDGICSKRRGFHSYHQPHTHKHNITCT